MKCKSCGYARNKPEDKTCNLCGAVLGGGDIFVPPDDVRMSLGKGKDLRKAKVEPRPKEGLQPEQVVYAGDFAIAYVFVPARGDLIILSPGEVFTFGRGDVCDYKIDSRFVSRRHARVHWIGTDPPVPELVDLESKNGITVNGVPVLRKVLEDNDEVVIGNTAFTMRVLSANEDLQVQAQCDRLAATIVSSDRLFGEIRLVPLPFLLTHLERMKESGTLSVMSTDYFGSVTMISGVAIAASFMDKEGEEAIRAVARLRAGRFSFSPRADAPPQQIGRTISELLAGEGVEPATNRLRRPGPPGPPPVSRPTRRPPPRRPSPPRGR